MRVANNGIFSAFVQQIQNGNYWSIYGFLLLGLTIEIILIKRTIKLSQDNKSTWFICWRILRMLTIIVVVFIFLKRLTFN